MRMTSLFLEQYGQYAQLKLTEEQLASPITIIYGPNEAGKSTIHAAIRAVLFGFNSKGILSTYANPNTSAQLMLTNEDDQLLRIERNASTKAGKVSLYDEQGHFIAEGQRAVQEKLGGISSSLFSNIFCFSHQELQRLETLQEDEVTAYLHSAAMGGGGLSLLDVEKRLKKKQEELFKPRATNPELNQLLAQLELEQNRITALEKKLIQYKPIQQELQRAEEQLGLYKKHRTQLEREKEAYEILAQLFVLLQRRRKLQVTMSELEAIESKLLPYEAELYELQMNAMMIREKEQELASVDREQSKLKEDIQASISRLGPQWSIEKVEHVVLSIPVKEQLLDMIQLYDRDESRLHMMKERLIEKQEASKRAEHKWQETQKSYADQQSRQDEGIGNEGFAARGRTKNKRLHLTKNWLWICTALLGLVVTGVLGIQGHAWEAGLVGAAFILVAVLAYRWTNGAEGVHEHWSNLMHKQEEHLAQQNIVLQAAKQDAQFLRQDVQEYEGKVLEAEQELQSTYQRALESLALLGIKPLGKSLRVEKLLETIEKVQQDILKSKSLEKMKAQLESPIIKWERALRSLYQVFEKQGINREDRVNLDERYQEEEGNASFYSSETETGGQAILELLSHKLKLEQEQHREWLECKRSYTQLSAEYSALLEQLPQELSHLKDELDQWTIAEIEGKSKELAASYEELLKQIEDHAQYMGHLKQSLEQIEQEDTLASLQHEFEQKKASFREKAKEWAAYSVARELCERTRRVYEEERQPAILQQASAFMSAFTLKRYQQVIAPMGEKELVLVDHNGKRWESSMLSTGTKEQLYLAMRFALIKQYEEQAVLPIIMDDPFVHFDSKRLQEVFRGLLSLADTHQVILFTCHEHYIDQFQALDSGSKLQVIEWNKAQRSPVSI